MMMMMITTQCNRWGKHFGMVNIRHRHLERSTTEVEGVKFSYHHPNNSCGFQI